jgi:hypothetical protein
LAKFADQRPFVNRLLSYGITCCVPQAELISTSCLPEDITETAVKIAGPNTAYARKLGNNNNIIIIIIIII